MSASVFTALEYFLYWVKKSPRLPGMLSIFFTLSLIASPSPAVKHSNQEPDNKIQDAGLTGISSFQQAKIDWGQFSGDKIKVLLSGHPIQVTAIRLLAEFNKLTGITVEIDVLPEEDFFQSLHLDLQKGKGSVDVFMTSPLYHWQYAHKGWIEDLTPYLENPKLTDKKWFGTDDFFPALWRASKWDGTIGSGLGKGGLYSIPIWWEGCTLAYRKDLAAQLGFKPPETWEDLSRQLVLISNNTDSKMMAFTTRGIRSWSQLHTYHMTMMASQGARDLNPKTMHADFNSPEAIEVGRYWVDLIRTTSSSAWASYNWYEVSSEFQAGRYFSIIDANAFSTILEAPDSPIKGKVGYLLPPAGKEGRQSSLWLWSIGINSASKNKGAAWLFTQWISSKHVLRKSVSNGNWMSPRKSVWFDPDVAAFLGKIDDGRWYDISTQLVTKLANMQWSPNPLAPMLGNIWAGAVQDAWLGKYSVKEALDKAAMEVNMNMQEAGYIK